MKRKLLIWAQAIALALAPFLSLAQTVQTIPVRTGVPANQYLGAATYANITTNWPAASYSGYTARATDIGVAPGMMFVADGTRWMPDGMQVLERSAVPVGIAPSGSMANNGAVTLGTALDLTYSGGIYLYYPASAIVAGSSAGLYWTVMSSTTVGTVYNNTYTSGAPAAPASPTPFVTTGPGAFTGATSEVTLITSTIAANLLGVNGAIHSETWWSVNNNANAKTPRIRWSGGAGTATSLGALASSLMQRSRFEVQNRGAANSQLLGTPSGGGGGGWGATTGIYQAASVDTTAATTLVITGQKATATDYVILAAYVHEILP